MAVLKEIRRFTDGMDTDTDLRDLPNGRYTYGRNIRVFTSDDESAGSVQNIKGNTEIPFTFPVGTGSYKVIGSCESIGEDSVYYFIYNSTGQHCIFKLDTKTNTITKVLYRVPMLNFQSDREFWIYHSSIVGGCLYWTDGYNPPSMINIQKAINYTKYIEILSSGRQYVPAWSSIGLYDNTDFVYEGGVYYQCVVPPPPALRTQPPSVDWVAIATPTPTSNPNNLMYPDEIDFWNNIYPYHELYYQDLYPQILGEATYRTIDQIKSPPLISPIVSYGSDPSKLYNSIRGKLWQVAYRYIYDNNEKSTFSPASKLPLPQNEIDTTGKWNEDITLNNILRIGYNTGYYEVKRVEIIAREGTSSGVVGDWYLVDTIEMFDEDGVRIIPAYQDNTYIFDNSKSKTPLEQTDVARLFDYVPLTAKAQELIEGNRLCWGNIKEGFDNIDVDVVVQAHETTDSIESAVANLDVVQLYPYITISFPIIADVSGMTFTINLKDKNGGLRVFNVVGGGVIRDTTDVVSEFVADMNTSGYPGFLGKFFISGAGYAIRIYYSDGVTTFVTYVSGYYDTTQNNVFPSLKTNAWHQFGIVYYDRANRSGTVNADDSTRFFLPTPANPQSPGKVYDMYYEINHRPPLWATHYQWVYSKNSSYQNILQYNLNNIAGVGVNLEWDINLGISGTIAVDPKYNVGTYVWQKGDRLRLLYYYDSVGTQFVYLPSSYRIDVEIIGQAGSGNLITETFAEWTNFSTFIGTLTGGTAWIVVEVYTPKKELSEKIFYEIGECYEIGDSGLSTRYHKGGTQNQTALLPAKGYITVNDIYVRMRFDKYASSQLTFPVEDYSYCDYYDSNMHDYGRVNAIDADAKQVVLLGGLRYSNPYVENTNLNGLNTVAFSNYDQLSERYGGIYKLIQVGYILKAIQEHKLTSIYIGRLTNFNADGSDNLTLTDRVIGSKNPHPEDYGTTWAGSVVRHDGNIYFLDTDKGKVLRNALNGTIAVSDYFLKNYFATKSKLMRDSGSLAHCIAGFNEKHNEYYIRLEWNDGATKTDTVIFNEALNKWTSFIWASNYPEHISRRGQVFITFLNGQVFLEETNNLRCNFFGVQESSLLRFVGNENPYKVKVWDALSITSNKKWSAPTIKTPITISYPNGMLSRLNKDKFVTKEGVHYANFLRDLLTTGVSSQLSLATGRVLRGDYVEVWLENTDTDFVYLHNVIIDATLSEKSK